VLECKGDWRLRVAPPVDAPAGTLLWAAVRPEKIQVTPDPPVAPGDNCCAGTVLDVGYLGDASVYNVMLDTGLVLKASAANRLRLTERPVKRGDRVWLSWPDNACVVLTQ
jgi:putrescine transport system ATP-binding protein